MARRHRIPGLVLVVFLGLAPFAPTPQAIAPGRVPTPDSDPRAGITQVLHQSGPPNAFRPVRLKSRDFVPASVALAPALGSAESGRDRVHILLQLDFIPRQAARDAYSAQGIELLAYVPEYTWIASVPAGGAGRVLDAPGVVWMGALSADDKLAGSIREGQWAAFALSEDGIAAVHVVLHRDESLETGRALVEAYGGRTVGEVQGTGTLVVELPGSSLRALAAEDAVQWIEPVGPPLSGTNDGIRGQINANVLYEAPYDLRGTNVDVLIYDSGQVGEHVDFGSRLIHGDADAVSSHSTHVAGTVGGSGANSVNEGGSSLQWRGVAPSADLISYGTGYSGSGFLFYENVPDIEVDWAAAQNAHGADMGTASVGANIYSNYPGTGCHLMGKYGASAVLIDQIVRGGNSVVGIGDKYIATWSVGNERGWGSTCGGRSYELIAPPAAAKNPIVVGAANSNVNTQYLHTSWGPTDDGRIKPLVTAGGCQTTGDMGVTSTDDAPVNGYHASCSTSSATAAVAGGVALMLEQYRRVYNTSGRFWPSTARTILIQTASDKGRSGPDYEWGYGIVDIQAAVDLISRKAFRQENIDDDEVDVYSLVVPTDEEPLRVSLAWDDHEATVNANPTLINDLDLELVAPDGTTWHPWTLDPDHPTANATRGVNDVDNQEQVEVESPDVGTWLVRVKGTTVPQGPQDYSLACEGCRTLDVGVCQSRVNGTVSVMSVQQVDPADGEAGVTGVNHLTVRTPEDVSEGEAWQRALEAASAAQAAARQGDPATEAAAGLAALEAARQVGPEAVVALLDTLRGPALDATIDEIQQAQEALDQRAPILQPGEPPSRREEQAALDAQRALDAAHRRGVLTTPRGSEEAQVSVALGASLADAPAAPPPGVERTVGRGCDYATLGEALAAADPGDTLLLEGGVTFHENVTIGESVALEGGYKGCGSGSADPTTIDGGGSGQVFEIAAGLRVTLENLGVTNGDSGNGGGGIRFAAGASGTGNLTLTNVAIYGNSAKVGGGLWVGRDAQVTGVGVQIHGNSALDYGGGVRLFGGRASFEESNIYGNAAPKGGGVYATQEGEHSPELDLVDSADLSDNEALTGDGQGGGLYMVQGTVSASDGSDFYSNEAIRGGGAYIVTSTLTLNGAASEIQYNTSSASGGGVCAYGSIINLDDQAGIEFNQAGTGGSGSGGGTFLDDSSLYSDKASINNNAAQNSGGGVYAINGSVVDLDLGTFTCLGAGCSRVYNNVASTGYGGGIYLSDSMGWLDHTMVENNRAKLGGGLYAYAGTVYANSTLFARNDAVDSIGDGVRLYNDASLVGDGTTIAYNNSGGSGNGRAIDTSDADLTLSCSVIWGHASSIGTAGHDVTYSDVQGGYDGEGNMDVNPLFVAPASSDYHLQVTSPVIDKCLIGHSPDFDAEQRPIVRHTGASPYDMGADEVAGAMRVGLNDSGCVYATLQQAVNAAAEGDTLQIAEGVYFENLTVTNKDLVLEGGYDAACTAAGTGPTRIEGSMGTGSTVHAAGGNVVLRHLDLTWGGGNGGGLMTVSGAEITLDDTTVYDNHGSYGGGIYVANGTTVTLTNDSDVVNNTASLFGGGARVWGKLIGMETQSDINDNCAPHGGGASVPGGTVTLDGSDMRGNEAADVDGQGGGLHVVDAGAVTLLGNAWVYEGTAHAGAGLYLDGSTADLGYSCVGGNAAEGDGGGIYLTNSSTLTGSNLSLIGKNRYANTARDGGGVYASDSTIRYAGIVSQNEASQRGGGIAALEGSKVTLVDAVVSQNEATVYGGGVYADDSAVNVSHTRLHGNMGARGGAFFQEGAAATGDLRNTLIYSNTAAAQLGAGIRSQAGVVTMTHVTLANNINGAGYSQSTTDGFAVNSIAWGNEFGGFWVTSGDLSGTCSLDETGNAGPALDPRFVSPGAGEDYHLRQGSPAIDRCAAGLAEDLDHVSRPMGNGYDAGAYEHPLRVYLPLVHRG